MKKEAGLSEVTKLLRISKSPDSKASSKAKGALLKYFTWRHSNTKIQVRPSFFAGKLKEFRALLLKQDDFETLVETGKADDGEPGEWLDKAIEMKLFGARDEDGVDEEFLGWLETWLQYNDIRQRIFSVAT